MHQLNTADVLVFATSLLASAGFGIFHAYRRNRNLKLFQNRNNASNSEAESYFLGNRHLQFFPTAASLFTSFVSAITMVGMPAEFYQYGSDFLGYGFSLGIGAILAGCFLVPVVYELQLMSTIGYVEVRFHSKALRTIAALNAICCTTFYIGVATMAPCVALEGVTDFPAWASIILTGIFTLLYSVVGGMSAIVIVDSIQSFLMFIGLIFALIVGISNIEGGLSSILETAIDYGRFSIPNFDPDPRRAHSLYALIIPTIVANAGLFGMSQGAVQRFSSLPSKRQAVYAVFLAAPLLAFLVICLYLLAMTMFTHYKIIGCDPLKAGDLGPNQLATYYVTEIISPFLPGLVGLWFAAIFSGAISSISTGYNSVAALFWDNLIKDSHFGKSLSNPKIRISLKLLSLTVGITSMAIAIAFKYIPGSAVKLVITVTGVFESATYVIWISGLFIPHVAPKGLIIGVLSGISFTGFIAIGHLLGYGTEVDDQLDSVDVNCTAINRTITDPQTKIGGFIGNLFGITPFYYHLINIVTGCLIASIASLWFKNDTIKNIQIKTIHPWCRQFVRTHKERDVVDILTDDEFELAPLRTVSE